MASSPLSGGSEPCMGDILSDFMLTQEVPVAWKVLRGDCSCRIQGEEFRVRLDSGEGTRFWQTDRILGEQIGSSRDLKGLVASAVRYLGQDCFGAGLQASTHYRPARTTGQHGRRRQQSPSPWLHARRWGPLNRWQAVNESCRLLGART